MIPTANQRHIDQFYNKVSVIKQTANCRGRRGADSTDCLIFGQDVQHQIVIHSPEIKTDSLAVCLSGIFSVTDRWVITVSQSWQAVETKKVEMWNKRLDERGGQGGGRRLSASCYRRVNEKMKWKWILHLVILFLYPNTEHFMPKITFSSAFVPWNSNTLPHSLEDWMLFVVITSQISRCTWKFKPITPSNFWIIPSVPPVLYNFQFHFSVTSNATLGRKYFTFSSFSFLHLLILWTQTCRFTVWAYSLVYAVGEEVLWSFT